MNDFLDNLGKVVNETAKKAIKASGNVVELTKTSLNIKFDEVKRDSFFKEIGKIVYNTYKISPESAVDEILDFCKCIDEIENSIIIQKSKVAAIQNKKYCVDCGVILGRSVNYCYSCGSKQPEIIDEDESDEDCCCCCSEDAEEAECDCEEEAETSDADDCCCGDSGDSCDCTPEE
ncbi:MAG: hypothetical protein FWF92_05470 [Oscillospiraceae bacterium]|nr:hypothetical protein [Oscillospiraceae bacterium]